ncbi:hypothetical protein B0H13DRAFT_1600795 [Mycena leptocephala]|nr:hypothetical protein B0H13DRAFT_1600795 [Mycena leptocephala]
MGISSDLILRSSDRVDFHTHKTLLAFVSPVFQDMFTFPLPPLPDGENPVVQLSEPSNALHRLLLMCYPQALTKQMFANLDGVCLAYHAADKYQILGAKDAILATLPTFVQDEPYRTYAVACHLGLSELATSAAGETLKDYFLPHEITAPEFDLISGAKLLPLHKFHLECGAKAANLANKDTVSVSEADFAGAGFSWPFLPDAPWWTSKGHDAKCGASVYSSDNYGGGGEIPISYLLRSGSSIT